MSSHNIFLVSSSSLHPHSIGWLHDGVPQPRQRSVVPSCLPAPPPLPPRARARLMSQLQPGIHTGGGPVQWPNTEYITAVCLSLFAKSLKVSNVPFLASPGGHHCLSRPFPHKSPVIVTKQNADESPRSEQRTPETWPRPAHPCADYTQTQTDKTQLTRNQ